MSTKQIAVPTTVQIKVNRIPLILPYFIALCIVSAFVALKIRIYSNKFNGKSGVYKARRYYGKLLFFWLRSIYFTKYLQGLNTCKVKKKTHFGVGKTALNFTVINLQLPISCLTFRKSGSESFLSVCVFVVNIEVIVQPWILVAIVG